MPIVLLTASLVAWPATAQEPDVDPWVFVSIPDFLNFDLADLTEAPGWDGGAPGSSPELEAVADGVLDAVAAEDPDFVLVAGDLVNGVWDFDSDGRHMFGPVSTTEEKQAAIQAAGDLFYPRWLSRFTSRGLTVHPAIGDHEIGDNPWDGRAELVGTYKSLWARTFTEGRYSNVFQGTAYAFQHRNLLIVTVDVFTVIGDDVHVRVSNEQLNWLDATLSASDAEFVIVQGHTPVLGPVNSNWSSRLMMEEGADSRFWKLLCDRGVDLYLAGEMHAVTVNQGCLTQVVHGGYVGRSGSSSYLKVTVGDDLALELRRAPLTMSGSERLWQTSLNRPWSKVYLGEFETTGTATYAAGRYRGEGSLRPITTFDHWRTWSIDHWRQAVLIVSLILTVLLGRRVFRRTAEPVLVGDLPLLVDISTDEIGVSLLTRTEEASPAGQEHFVDGVNSRTR